MKNYLNISTLKISQSELEGIHFIKRLKIMQTKQHYTKTGERSVILVRLEKHFEAEETGKNKDKKQTPRTRFTLAASQTCRRVQQPGQDSPSAAAGREWQ